MFSMFLFPNRGFLGFLCFLYIAWGDDHGWIPTLGVQMGSKKVQMYGNGLSSESSRIAFMWYRVIQFISDPFKVTRQGYTSIWNILYG